MPQYKSSRPIRLAVALTSAAAVAMGCSPGTPDAAPSATPTSHREESSAPHGCDPVDYPVANVDLAPISDFLGYNGTETFIRQWDAAQSTAEQLLEKDGVPHNTRIEVHVSVGNMALDSELDDAEQILGLATDPPNAQLTDSTSYEFTGGKTLQPSYEPLEPTAGTLALKPFTPVLC